MAQEKKEIVLPKLSAAQIENRRYSIFIKNLSIQDANKNSRESEQVAAFLQKDLSRFGPVVSVSVDGSKKTAIVRFRQIFAAEAAYAESREKRWNILGEAHESSQVIYVIPEKSVEELKV